MTVKKTRKPKDQRSDVKNRNNREHRLDALNKLKQEQEKKKEGDN